jgi:CHAT domain-containing protein/tetratricopeptide (TPR) repeat protein
MRLPFRVARHVIKAYDYLQRTSGNRAENLEQAIMHLAKALEALDSALYPRQWALRQNDLASAYTERVRGDRAENLETAITHYLLALDVDPACCEPGDVASFHKNLADAYMSRLRGERAQNIDDAIAGYEQAIKVFTHEDHPEGWAQLQQLLGTAYSDRVNGDRAQNTEDAIDHLRKALTVFTSGTHPELWAGISSLLAIEYGDREMGDRAQNLEDAIALFEQALRVYTPGTDPLASAGVHGSLGAVYLNRVRGEPGQNAEAAVLHLQRALELLGGRDYDESTAETEARLGIAYLKLPGSRSKNIEQALPYLGRAVAFLSDQPAELLTASAQASLGHGYLNRYRGDPAQNVEQAIRVLEAAVATCRQLGDQQERATASLDLAIAYMRRVQGDQAENAEQAMEHYRDALVVYRRDTAPVQWAGIQRELCELYNNTALRGDRAQNIEQAIEHGERALEVYTRDTRPRDWADTQIALAEAWRKRLTGQPGENFANAREHLHHALGVYTRESDPFEWARIENLLGTVYLEDLRAGGVLGPVAHVGEQAVRHLRLALEVYTADAYPERHAGVTANLGFALAANVAAGGRPDYAEEAIRDLERSLEATARDAEPTVWAATHTNLGLAYYHRASGDRSANLSAAAEHLSQALEVFTPEAFPASCRNAAEALARINFDRGAWSESLVAFNQAAKVGEALLASAYTETGRRAEASETSRLYAEAAWCLLELRRPGEALQRLEAGKARLLAEALALRDLDTGGLPETDQTAIRAARDQVRLLEADMRRDRAPASGGGASAADQLRAARAELVRLSRSVRQEHPGLLPTGAAEQEILRLVPPGGALVAPVVTSKGGVAFVLPHNTAEVGIGHALSLPSLTTAALRSLLNTEIGIGQPGSVDPESDADRLLGESTAQLWELLVGPVHQRLVDLGLRPGAPVCILPQGGLALLPLHAACRTEEGRPRYFLDDWTLTYAPSAYALMASRRRLADSRHREPSLLAVADPTSDLPFARHEADDVRAAFPADRCQVLLGPDATRARLLEAADGYSHLHLACHGTYAWDDPMDSHLLLANRDPLTLAEIISQLDLEQSRLVALSACETGLTDVRAAPDEYVGLPAAFLQAGAPAVLASLWPVSDLSASLLIGRFYRYHIGDQRDPATALRQAQLWLREASASRLGLAERWELEWRRSHDQTAFQAARYWRAHPDEIPFAHPYHWAAFICVGE